MTIHGLSRSRLDRLHKVLAGYVTEGKTPGLVAAISRRGQEHVEVLGTTAVGGSVPMARDTLFRITSMTKPITAVAAMILVEECKLRLDEPVDRLLPELANRRVLRQIDSDLDDTVPANRPITLRDLLTMRMGFGMILGPPDRYPIQRAVEEQKIYGVGKPTPIPHTPDEWIRRFGALPLMYQPGERWQYNTGAYVLGVLIARAARQPLESFFQERIFAPLGMKDTSFSVPAAKLGRLTAAYFADPATGALALHDAADTSSPWSQPPVFPDGGAGLVSTLDDCLAFGQMMLNKGKFGATRLLSRPSVETMTADHLSPSQKALSTWLPGYWDHRGWGFGMQVFTRREDPTSTPGRFGWDGGFGTSWYTDPAEDLVAVLLTQRGEFPLFSPLYLDFWNGVYQSLDD